MQHTEVSHESDLRIQDPEFVEAKRNEILGLIDKGTFRLVLREEAGPSRNVMPSRYVLDLKHENSNTRYKARFVLGSHRDRDKHSIVHNSSTLRHYSIRMIMALATILGFDIWSADVTQAYLRAVCRLQRKVFTCPEVLDLSPEELIQIILPMYGLTESGDYWHETLHYHHMSNLRIRQSTGDFSLFYRRIANRLIALSGSYDDDLTQACPDKQNSTMLRSLRQQFDISVNDSNEIIVTGLKMDLRRKEIRSLSQRQYIARLSFLPGHSSFSQFRSTRARLAWVNHFRPDICCAMSFHAQNTATTFEARCIQSVKRIIGHLRRTAEIQLQFFKLDQPSLRMLVYVDASFNNAENHRSQVGYVILLADALNRCFFLHFASCKSKWTTRSSTAAETLAFMLGFDAAFLIRHDIQAMLGQHIPIFMLTDSHKLFTTLTPAKMATERRLMVDIASVREAYNERTIADAALIRFVDNYEDCLNNLAPMHRY